MKKYIECIIVALLCSWGAAAQIVFNENLPVDPHLHYGILPNGFTYYIYPLPGTGAVNLKLVTKIGSVVENQDELGLAHFLEHMTFEGTKNYPHDSGSKILQAYGLVSGSDFNAATSFDDTQFDIKNIDANDSTMLPNALHIIKDWACNLTLEDKAIDKERSIVEEEWRTSHDYGQRLADSLCRSLLHGSQYASRFPIGSMKIIRNFKPSLLREFYRKWYRPDLQAIIVVGDIDAARVENEVKMLFGSIPSPASAPMRKQVAVPDHKGIDYNLFVDDEAPSSDIGIFFLHDKISPEMMLKKECYRREAIGLLSATLLSLRLLEQSSKAECAYSSATCTDGTFLIAKHKAALALIAMGKEGMTAQVMEQLLTEARRAQLYGFTADEINRAKRYFITNVDNQLKEVNTLKRTDYTAALVDHFEGESDLCGFETSLRLMREIVENHVTADDINSYLRTHIKADNVSVSISGPKKDGIAYPTKQDVERRFSAIFSSTPPPYEEKVRENPIVDHTPAAGQVLESSRDSLSGITSLVLSNGMRVLLKPTNFKNDEIRLNGYSPGGYNVYKGTHDIALRAMNAVIEGSALGNNSITMLEKQLLAKNVSLYFNITPSKETFVGKSGNADFETMLQLLYLYFTDVRKDPQSFNSVKSNLASQNSQIANNPSHIFQDSVTSTLYPGYIYYKDLLPAEIQSIDYDEVLQLYRERVANPGDYVFTLVGSFNVDSIVPLINKYMASIPDNGVREVKMTPTPMRHGRFTNAFSTPMATPKSTIDIEYFGPMKWTTQNELMIDMLQGVINDELNQKIREEEASSYGVKVMCDINETMPVFVIACSFDTNNEKKDELLAITRKYFKSLTSKGVSQEQYNKVYNQQVNQYYFGLQSNDFWVYTLYLRTLGINYERDLNASLGTMSNLKFNLFIKSLKLNDELTTVMEGLPKQQ